MLNYITVSNFWGSNGINSDVDFQCTSNAVYGGINFADCQNLKINASYVYTKKVHEMAASTAPGEEMPYENWCCRIYLMKLVQNMPGNIYILVYSLIWSSLYISAWFQCDFHITLLLLWFMCFLSLIKMAVELKIEFVRQVVELGLIIFIYSIQLLSWFCYHLEYI